MGRKSRQAGGSAKPALRRKAKPPEPADARVRDLEIHLAEAVGQVQARERDLAEAQEQLTAASEILRVISRSPTDYQPVFIELHGGRIWVKSQVGQGSTFTFTVPAQRGG